jgi:orotate phosphoribosyltransferase-like protein
MNEEIIQQVVNLSREGYAIEEIAEELDLEETKVADILEEEDEL